MIDLANPVLSPVSGYTDYTVSCAKSRNLGVHFLWQARGVFQHCIYFHIFQEPAGEAAGKCLTQGGGSLATLA